MIDIKYIEPIEITKGDTIKWNRVFDNYPASEWELNYTFKSSSGTEIDTLDYDDHITANGDEFNVVIPASDTALYDEEIIFYEGKVSKDGEVYTAVNGFFKLIDTHADLSDINYVKRTLDGLKTLVQGKTLKDVDSYSIYGRSLTAMNISELRQWEADFQGRYNRILNKERVRKGLGSRNISKVRFP